MRKVRRRFKAANNYTESLKNYNLNFKVKKSIDYMEFSINKNVNKDTRTKLIKMLKQIGFKVISNTWAKQDRHYARVIKLYDNEYKTIVKIFYGMKDGNTFYPKLKIRIDDPCKDLLVVLNSIFKYELKIYPKISTIELTMDMQTKSIFQLNELIENHLFQRYQYKQSRHYKTTYYSTDIRYSSKGCRLYPKKIDGKCVLRLELVLHRPVMYLRQSRRLDGCWPLEGAYSQPGKSKTQEHALKHP